MKFYRNALLLVALAVANYYGIQYGYLGLNTPKDWAVVAGMLGLAFLAITDLLIIYRVARAYAKKAEEKICQLEKQTQAAEAVGAESPTTSAPIPQGNLKGSN